MSLQQAGPPAGSRAAPGGPSPDGPAFMTPIERHQAFAFGWSTEEAPHPVPLNPLVGPAIPSLLDVSLQALFTSPESLAAAVVFLPPHLRCRASRYAAIHFPQAFYGGLEVEAYDDTDDAAPHDPITFVEVVSGSELNYVGDGRSGTQVRRLLEAYDESMKSKEGTEYWDESPPVPDGPSSSLPLTMIHLMGIPVALVMKIIPLLPPTLSRLSLLSLTVNAPTLSTNPPENRILSKLSKQLPSLELLDLSFNSWLIPIDQVKHVEWSTAWQHLTTFGVRSNAGGGLADDTESFDAEDPSHYTWVDEDTDWNMMRIRHPPGSIESWMRLLELVNGRRQYGTHVRIAC